jgi:hypothetical protein
MNLVEKEKEKKQLSNATSKRCANLPKKPKNFKKKKKIHKLIIKEIKLNVNHYIKTDKNYDLLKGV